MLNNDQEKVIVLRCFGYPGMNGGEKGFYAVCIDLNLVTWRLSPVTAKESLDKAIKGYIETAINFSDTPTEFEELINKSSPFFPYRLMYHLIAIKVAVSRKQSRYSQTILYNNPVKVPGFAAGI